MDSLNTIKILQLAGASVPMGKAEVIVGGLKSVASVEKVQGFGVTPPIKDLPKISLATVNENV